MKRELNLADKIWEIAYPVLTYYVAITIGSYIAQLLFGAGIENYMLCKIIGSMVAIPVVFADYKNDLIMTGRYRLKSPIAIAEVKQMVMVMAITICLSVGLNNLIVMSPLVQMSEEYQNASDALYSSSLGLELLGSALITPYLEELLHRGVVFGRLRRRMQMWPAVIVSALIFAILHFNIVQFIYTFLLGIVFALFREKSGKLYPAVLAHIVANAIAVIRTELGLLQQTVDSSVFAWVISTALCFMGVGLLFVFWRNEKGNKNE